MNVVRSLCLFAVAIVFSSCQNAIFDLTPQEKAVLDFNVSGVKIGGPPGQLALFSQVQHIPIKLGGYDVWEVYNVSANISQLKAWYFDNRLVRLELRYFNGPSDHTLARAGGWEGIRNYLFQKFGPPSRFGSDVPILATNKGSWNVKYAKFNGEWVFSRIKRQINYSAMADANEGIGVVTIMDTTPVAIPESQTTVAPAPKTAAPVVAERAPEEVAPRVANPGF
jgi:hypothetical protein